ncbi:hypothetical protein [[Clostridium] innocuum]|uniref:hypothetical protein n=1 Tax=Clostridium innocuum TaxID=1522 RepID=UPI000D6B033B|nr:hypothetical protein [[Clostridium] innocuum]PWJ19771.1 hypothetical protein ATF84_101315 [[Clostridium] innocuum]SSA37493.1 hypothetical protein SAMN04487929_101315 [[Clostridium] innocuum]
MKKKKRKRQSTRELINTKTITDYSLQQYGGDELVFFLMEPQNLSVMSRENIGSKIFALTNVLKGMAELEMVCLNSRDNFEENKLFLKKRMDTEENEKVRQLLQKDLLHLDKIQIQTATARLFLLTVRIKPNDQVEVMQLIHRIEKLIKLQNLTVKRASKDDLKSMLAVYFEQNVTTDRFEDRDGERWYQDASV